MSGDPDGLVQWLHRQLTVDSEAAAALDETALSGVESTAGHAAREHLERWATDVEAKRRIIDVLRGSEPNVEWDTQPDMGLRLNNQAGALRAMAAQYDDRPGYHQAWRP